MFCFNQLIISINVKMEMTVECLRVWCWDLCCPSDMLINICEVSNTLKIILFAGNTI